MLGLIKSAHKSVSLTGFDAKQGPKVAAQRTDIHIAGVSCAPFSPMGLRDGEDGEAGWVS